MDSWFLNRFLMYKHVPEKRKQHKWRWMISPYQEQVNKKRLNRESISAYHDMSRVLVVVSSQSTQPSKAYNFSSPIAFKNTLHQALVGPVKGHDRSDLNGHKTTFDQGLCHRSSTGSILPLVVLEKMGWYLFCHEKIYTIYNIYIYIHMHNKDVETYVNVVGICSPHFLGRACVIWKDSSTIRWKIYVENTVEKKNNHNKKPIIYNKDLDHL